MAPIKKENLKKEERRKVEKIYLRKGFYALNDIYYDIFQSNNGKHYFSFVNSAGRTVLLNGDINGFETLEEAENTIEDVLKFAKQKDRFDIKTAKDGKLYFNLYNDKGEKIAKSFFFRKREDIEQSRDEFLKGKPSNKIGPSTTSKIKTTRTVKEADIIPISNNINTADIKNTLEQKSKIDQEQKELEAKRLLKIKWEEEKRKQQIEKEKKIKEREVILAASKEKRTAAKIQKEQEKKEAAKVLASRNPMKDDDLFDGCFRWLWIISALLILALILSYFKGCFGNSNNTVNNIDSSGIAVDSTDNNIDNSTKAIGSSLDELADKDQDSSTEIEAKDDDTESTGVQSDAYINGIQKVASCNCSTKAIVFDIPSSEAKKINKLGTNPQFGNTHGLSPADFLEDLKYRYQNSSWDRSYLNYLYKAMGYNGFQDAQSDQISQEELKPGVKGILGFGSYSGYAYSQLDLKGKDLKIFRIEAANGCHINFMKTCGNLFFICE